MKQDNKCPNCGQYKLRSSKIAALSVGIFLVLCGAWLSLFTAIWGIFGITRIVFFAIGAIVIAAGATQKGSTCQNCKYQLLNT